jgi:Fe-S cluster biogenesis protein NfuA
MVTSGEDKDFRQRLQRLETLIQEVDGFADPFARAKTREIVQTILDLHAVGLESILNHIAQARTAGVALIDVLAQDPLVGSLLLLYSLHPLDLETRVRRALDRVRPVLQARGGDVELVSVRDGAVRVRLHGSGPSSVQPLQRAVEEAIYDQAPDLMALAVDEVLDNGEKAGDGQTRMALPLVRG